MASNDPNLTFAIAKQITRHIGVDPADQQFKLPESYLFVQDELIIASGTFWVLAYFFYSIRCFSERRCAMPFNCMYVSRHV